MVADLTRRSRRAVVVARQQRAFAGATDIAPEAGGRIAVAALTDIVGLQGVVVGEGAASAMLQRRAAADLARHPEGVQVADPIVGAALGHRHGLVGDRDRADQFGLEPGRQTRWRDDVQHAVTRGDDGRLFRLHGPLAEALAEVVGEQASWRRLGGERCRGEARQQAAAVEHQAVSVSRTFSNRRVGRGSGATVSITRFSIFRPSTCRAHRPWAGEGPNMLGSG